MKKSFRYLCISALLILIFSHCSDEAGSEPADTAAKAMKFPHVRGQLIVRLQPESDSNIADLMRINGANVRHRYKSALDGLVLIELNDPEKTEKLLRILFKRKDVIYAEPNYIVEPAVIPNDPEFPKSWGLNNTGQRFRVVPKRIGTADMDIDAPEAWDSTTGSASVVVAVIDTGINTSHPDLAGSIWTNTGEIESNGIDDDANGYIDDIRGWNFRDNTNNPADNDGHGTSVAGIIGAVGDNSTGTCGACWNVSLMPLRVGLGEDGSISQIVQAIQYAIDEEADVINASWGTSGLSQALYDAIAAAGSANIPIMVAAGNSSNNVDSTPYYPSSFTLDNIISTAAIDANGELASFSNYGAVTVDIAAPGVDIYTTDLDGHNYFSGTSAAAPFVAGTAALVIASNPGIAYLDLRTRIINCSHYLETLNGKCISSGMLNAYNALNFGQPAVQIDSVSQSILGTSQSSTIDWTCMHDGTYSVEVGGNGTPGSGIVITTGSCQTNDNLQSIIDEEDLPDNQASTVYIIIPEAPCARFATVTLYDDQTGPETAIAYPYPDSTLGELAEISGTAADSGGAEVSYVKIAISDGSYYFDNSLFQSVTPVYINTTGTTAWTFDASVLPLSSGTSYTILAQSEDSAGNIAASPDQVTFHFLSGAPIVIIESISNQVLGSGASASITWVSDLAGSYSIETGGDGTPGSGTEIGSGSCDAVTPTVTAITESDLVDDSQNKIFIFVTSSLITGSASFVLYDDQTPPSSSIIHPLNNQDYSEMDAITGTANDTGSSEIAEVEVQISDGTSYWDDNSFSETESWVKAEGAANWSLDTSQIPWIDFTYYTVKTRATDSAGNTESPSGGVTFYYNSGSTIIIFKKDKGCSLSGSAEPDASWMILFALILALLAIRRRNKAIEHPDSSAI